MQCTKYYLAVFALVRSLSIRFVRTCKCRHFLAPGRLGSRSNFPVAADFCRRKEAAVVAFGTLRSGDNSTR